MIPPEKGQETGKRRVMIQVLVEVGVREIGEIGAEWGWGYIAWLA